LVIKPEQTGDVLPDTGVAAMTSSFSLSRFGSVARRVDTCDAALCNIFNQASGSSALLKLFRAVSRLGDGIFWYTLIVIMFFMAGRNGLFIAIHMAATGLTGVVIYKLLKNCLVRERPYINHKEISCTMPPLDRYSFPSGHTMHAVGFSLVACSYFPELSWALYPFATLVAVSRLVLGLHYPTDVLAGALLGYALATLSIEFISPGY